MAKKSNRRGPGRTMLRQPNESAELSRAPDDKDPKKVVREN
jgi:hypothetical protein